MTSEREIYFAELELDRFQMLTCSKLYLTKEEYEFCLSWDSDSINNFSYIGDYSMYGDYLNLNLYSEQDNDEKQLELEVNY